MKHETNKKGFTLIELLVVMSIIALLLSILMPALGRARAEAMLTKDNSQVKAVYGGFSFWGPTHDGRFPTPGLERRLDTPSGPIKGRGGEDITHNDHAAMLSMCVQNNLFTPDILVSPTEGSEFVDIMSEYDYESYSVADWVFWDPTFRNDISGENEPEISHNSYGIMPLTGKRMRNNWKVGSSSFALLGTRGPMGGIEDEASNSYQLHGIDQSWKGVLAFGDGHIQVLESFHPDSTTYVASGGESLIDNIFAEDLNQSDDPDYGEATTDVEDPTGHGADSVLTHVDTDDDEDVGGVSDDGTKAGGATFIHDNP